MEKGYKETSYKGSSKVCEEPAKGSKTIHTLLAVRCKGRPRGNRLKSKVEQAVTRKRKKNTSVGSKEKSNAGKGEQKVSSRRGRKKANFVVAQQGEKQCDSNNKEGPQIT